MKFQASPQQKAFFEWIEFGEGSAILEATAGAGKTTTLIHALQLMKGWIFFGAYNKKIAEEIAAKAPKRDDLVVSTMHAAGFKMWLNVANNVKVESNKCRNIFREACSRYPEYKPFESAVLSLVSYAKQAAIGVLRPIADNSAWFELIEHFDIDCLDEEGKVVALAKKTLQRSIDQDFELVDFDDMIFAPLYHKVRCPGYDWVLIDEAQDTNAARRALALMMLKRGGRLVAVGDRHQAIYGFTGADADALDLIAAAVNAIRLPLTVTYRCPKNVVKEAHKYVKHIEAHESAPDGEVIHSDEHVTNLAKAGDAILSRFNVPIVKLAYQFIAKGISAKVEGRDIGNNLKALARKWKVKSFAALRDRLDAYVERETTKYRIKEQESKAASIEDRVACLLVLIDRVEQKNSKSKSPIDDLCQEIDSIFGEKVSEEHVLLSTIHKSKGREWETVIWLQTGTSKWARKDWELEQETNLCYVAATRAKSLLILATNFDDTTK